MSESADSGIKEPRGTAPWDTSQVGPGVQCDSLSLNIGGMRDWLSAGLTTAQLRNFVKAGDLVRLRRGVYATASFAGQAEKNDALRHFVQVCAAMHAQYKSRAVSVASHQSAAILHGISLLEAPEKDTVWLTRPPGQYRGDLLRGVRLHSAALPEDHVTTVLGTRVTAPARTVLDLARSLPYIEGVVAADSALQAGLTTKDELRRMLPFFSGWPGADKGRRVVEFSDRLAESPLESAARVTFAEHGLPAPELQADVVDEKMRFVGQVDFLWADRRTVAEADGMGKYEDGDVARKQIRRDNRLREAGYKVVHFTWAELFGSPERVIARIRTAFAASSAY